MTPPPRVSGRLSSTHRAPACRVRIANEMDPSALALHIAVEIATLGQAEPTELLKYGLGAGERKYANIGGGGLLKRGHI